MEDIITPGSDFTESGDNFFVTDKDLFPDEFENEDGGVGASQERGLNYFNEGHWVDSWSEAKKYAKSQIAKGNKWICVWIHDTDSSARADYSIEVTAAFYEKFNALPQMQAAWGGCPMTSPYPQAYCIQHYLNDWLDSNVPQIATGLKVVETSSGVKLTWNAPANATEQYVYVSYQTGSNSYLSKNYRVSASSGEYTDKNTMGGKKYFYSITAENEYGYSSSDNVTITTTHDGSEYKCSHSYSNAPTFAWASDRRSCTASAKCNKCGKTIKAKCSVTATSYKKADFSRDGSVTYKASTSSFGSYRTDTKTVTYPRISKVSLEYSSVTYKGKKCTPKVKVVDRNGKVIADKFYSITYSGNNRPGNAKATITFKSQDGLVSPYCGEQTKTFKIKLAKPKISKLTAKSKGFKVEYPAVAGAKSYIVEYSLYSDFRSSVKKSTSNAYKTISDLKAGKKYYVRVKAVYSSSVYSSYSDTAEVKTLK